MHYLLMRTFQANEIICLKFIYSEYLKELMVKVLLVQEILSKR